MRRAGKITLIAGVLSVCIGAVSYAGSWATDKESVAIKKEFLEFFEDARVRTPGMAGNVVIQEKVSAAFVESGFEHGEIEYPAACFIPGETSLTLPGGQVLQLLPSQPGLFRPGNFDEKDFEADVIYAEGDVPSPDRAAAVPSIDVFNGVQIKDAIILQEGSGAWQPFISFGPKGFIFISSEYARQKAVHAQVQCTETRIPRFYISQKDGDVLKQAVKAAGGRIKIRIKAEPSRWVNKTLGNPWVFIPGSDPELERDVVLLVAPLDSAGIVPELAEGGMMAGNLFMFMKIFDKFKTEKPARSVMMVGINARTQNYLGDRLLAWNLIAPMGNVQDLRDVMAKDLRKQQLMVKYYSELFLDGQHDAEDEAKLKKWRDFRDDSLGPLISIKDLLVTLAKKDVNRLRSKQVGIVRAPVPSGLSDEEIKAELDSREVQRLEIETERHKYVNILTLFNKVGIKTLLSDLYRDTPESVDILRGYVKQIIDTNAKWAELNQQDLDQSSANTECRTVLAGRRITFLLSFELDWESGRTAFASMDDFGDPSGWQVRFGRNTVDIAGRLPSIAGGMKDNIFVDTMSKYRGISEGYYFPSGPANGAAAAYHQIEATPAFSVRNVFSAYSRSFTLGDTLENVDGRNLATITTFYREFIQGIMEDPDITNPSELLTYKTATRRKTQAWTSKVSTFQFDEFSADIIPTLPVPNTVVIVRDLLSVSGVDPSGVVALHYALTDERSQTIVYGQKWDVTKKKILCDAFGFDADYTQIRYAVDAGDVHARVKSDVSTDTENEKTLALFRCKEFPVYTRLDSSLVSSMPIIVKKFIILSAIRNAAPRKYGFYGGDCLVSSKYDSFEKTGPFMAFAEPNERIKLITRKKRCLLNSVDPADKAKVDAFGGTKELTTKEMAEGVGYENEAELQNGFFDAVTRDMALLNNYRLSELKGVSDELAKEFIDNGMAALADMDTKLAEADYSGYLQSRYQALGAQAKAYEQTSNITNDMLKAVVFYMALLLPFCFFLQKLLFKTVKIEAQMGLFAVIFVGTFAVFRVIHPAFRISQSPEAMFIAFVMGVLALFVIKVLQGRFEGEMQLLFQTYTGMDTSEVAYSTAGQQAMLIGVQNMKRRKVRTALTTATIVLVTFTMLAFSSISKKMSPTVIPQAKAAPYTGIMYHWPGQVMRTDTENVLINMFKDKADIVRRVWLFSPRKMEGSRVVRIPMNISAVDDNKFADLDAVLGLSGLDNGFLDQIPLAAGSSYFSADDAMEVIVTTGVADKLGVTPDNLDGSSLRFMGKQLKVVGILDDERFRTMRDIDDRQLVPLQIALKSRSEQESAAVDADEEESKAGIEYVNTAMLVLMPVDTACSFRVPIAYPYSLSIRFKDDEPIWPHVESLLAATDAKFYVSSKVEFAAGGGENARKLDSGIYYMGSGYKTSIGGLSVLIIPLLIASTIILNTMLGAVYERKSEIAVYNAVGLNPNHIAMFFLAEAFVYSVIGSVGGYLIGQVMTLVLNKFQIVSDINLNFSSLNVVYVILFTVTIVMLSTLYPAHVATKTAIPSGKRKWSIPDNDGQRMEIAFPFIYQPNLVPGVMSYIEGYFARFTEASLGDLIANVESKTEGKDEKGRDTLEIMYYTALAPFDLGVTQKVTFRASFDELVDSYRVFMIIDRVSGQDTNWVWTNRPFLERLRQHLMRWRNLDPAAHQEYVVKGNESFEKARVQSA